MPLVMGVLNVTPDSFSDGGRYLDPDAAVAHGLELIAEGAAGLDAGGAASPAGAEPLGAGRERRRVALAYPVVVGTSRKSFLGRLLAASDGVAEPVPVDDRLEGSLATATWAILHGAAMIRAHDVRASVQAAKVVAA